MILSKVEFRHQLEKEQQRRREDEERLKLDSYRRKQLDLQMLLTAKDNKIGSKEPFSRYSREPRKFAFHNFHFHQSAAIFATLKNVRSVSLWISKLSGSSNPLHAAATTWTISKNLWLSVQ